MRRCANRRMKFAMANGSSIFNSSLIIADLSYACA
jgi:hypothetical protein